MSMMNVNWRPDRKGLREFGEAALAMMTVLGIAMVLLGRISPATALWFCASGLAVYVASRAWAPLVLPVYLALMGLSWPIGYVVSHVVMSIAFFLVFTPIGLIMRLCGRDPLSRRLQRGKSYWQPHRSPTSARQYFNQF